MTAERTAGEARHVFAARCPKGHVTYFDRRVVCPESGEFVRRRGGECDEILLTCGECGERFYVEVDCEGYK
jgi:hypothetical protein